MKYTKVIKSEFKRTPQDLAELSSNDHLREFEAKVWKAFFDLQEDLVYEFKLEEIRPFMEKLGKKVQTFAESLDPKIKAEIAKQLTQRQNKYK